MSLIGVDVSHHQGVIDWKKVKQSGVAFAYIKASEGAIAQLDYLKANYTKAVQAGLLVGVYHFHRSNIDSSTQSAVFLNTLRTAGAQSAVLPPMIDVETPDSTPAETIKLRLSHSVQQVEVDLKVRTILYTNKNFWEENHLGDGFSGHSLWIARYLHDAPAQAVAPPASDIAQVKPPQGFTKWDIWQYSEKGRVSGITTNVDLDYFPGSLDQLKALKHTLP